MRPFSCADKTKDQQPNLTHFVKISSASEVKCHGLIFGFLSLIACVLHAATILSWPMAAPY